LAAGAAGIAAAVAAFPLTTQASLLLYVLCCSRLFALAGCLLPCTCRHGGLEEEKMSTCHVPA
jgi:hypothetical protein